jgi:hypothetical protein
MRTWEKNGTFLLDPAEKADIDLRRVVRTLLEEGSFDTLAFYLLLPVVMGVFTRSRPFKVSVRGFQISYHNNVTNLIHFHFHNHCIVS